MRTSARMPVPRRLGFRQKTPTNRLQNEELEPEVHRNRERRSRHATRRQQRRKPPGSSESRVLLPDRVGQARSISFRPPRMFAPRSNEILSLSPWEPDDVRRQPHSRGFTLIELLVVIAIIAVLISLL